jgi:lipoprotein signal peptidase
MRTILLDMLGLAGYGALCYGLFLRFGLADALISGGAMLLVLALVGARGATKREARR